MRLDEANQVEIRAEPVLFEQHLPRIKAGQVLAVEHPVVIAGAWHPVRMPLRKALVEEQANLEVQVRAVLGDARARVGRAPERSDPAARGNFGASTNAVLNLTQVGVKRANLHAVDAVANHDIVAVVRKAGLGVYVEHHAVRDRQHRVNGFAFAITLLRLDVDAFVQLPAIRAHAAEGAAGPFLAHGRNEVMRLGTCHEDVGVRGGQHEARRCAPHFDSTKPQGRQPDPR